MRNTQMWSEIKVEFGKFLFMQEANWDYLLFKDEDGCQPDF